MSDEALIVQRGQRKSCNMMCRYFLQQSFSFRCWCMQVMLYGASLHQVVMLFLQNQARLRFNKCSKYSGKENKTNLILSSVSFEPCCVCVCRDISLTSFRAEGVGRHCAAEELCLCMTACILLRDVCSRPHEWNPAQSVSLLPSVLKECHGNGWITGHRAHSTQTRRDKNSVLI